MYLSRIIIKNYRSIKELNLTFTQGKNVIVGKNNSGKSNILKAINLILGDFYPAYHKTQNITEDDFYLRDTSEPIYIFCELTRDKDEELNFEEIYANCNGFFVEGEYKRKEWDAAYSEYYSQGETKEYSFSKYDLNFFWKELAALFSHSKEKNKAKSYYINGKAKSFRPFENEFEDKYKFAYAFKAEMNEAQKIEKDIRFLYCKNEKCNWVHAFGATIRNEILQCAVIQSFRNPSLDFKINNYNWYGKFLKKYVSQNYDEIKEAFEDLKDVTDKTFGVLTKEINDSNFNIAFPGTKLSFQCTPDSKEDIHKSVMLYVDDGFTSLITDKGSGIQSAVIIGLFDYYTRNYLHCSCSLLLVEEPELYLHPQGRRVISYRLDQYIDNGKNQVILTTHAPEFIASAHENLNLILVKKEKDSATTAMNTNFKDPKEKQILLKTENSEIYFADLVILVEGGEKYILESYSKLYGKEISTELKENWINDYNISIIDVGGKTEFIKYSKKLNELKIKNYILADFDYFFDGFQDILNNYADGKLKDSLNQIKSQIGYSKTESPKKKNILQWNDKGKFIEKCIDYFKKEKFGESTFYILEGDLEFYYTDLAKEKLSHIDGKERKPIYIASELVDDENKITTFVDCREYKELFDLIVKELPEV